MHPQYLLCSGNMYPKIQVEHKITQRTTGKEFFSFLFDYVFLRPNTKEILMEREKVEQVLTWRRLATCFFFLFDFICIIAVIIYTGYVEQLSALGFFPQVCFNKSTNNRLDFFKICH